MILVSYVNVYQRMTVNLILSINLSKVKDTQTTGKALLFLNHSINYSQCNASVNTHTTPLLLRGKSRWFGIWSEWSCCPSVCLWEYDGRRLACELVDWVGKTCSKLGWELTNWLGAWIEQKGREGQIHAVSSGASMPFFSHHCTLELQVLWLLNSKTHSGVPWILVPSTFDWELFHWLPSFWELQTWTELYYWLPSLSNLWIVYCGAPWPP